MTYNVLNYEDENSREDDYLEILEFVEPDILVTQEIIGQTGFEHFKLDVLDVFEPGEWSSATFTNQSAQQDIALFYKHDDFSFLSTSIINTAYSPGLRDVVEFVMNHESSGIEFNIYGVHLKASSGDDNAAQRLEEATVLRNYLNTLDEGSRFLVVGDFNIYSNDTDDEPAFDMLTGSSENNNGRLFDPIDRIGHWHNNSSYSDVHTQSPRTQSFGGGATGGMDDRFDWLFASESILDQESDMHYAEETYWAVGNDGNHFNEAINDGDNSSVSDAVADALHDASDHLPVYMDIWLNDLVYNDEGIVITEIMPNPSSVGDDYGEWFEIHNATDETIDIQGWTIKDLDNDEHVITSDAMSVLVNPGQFFVLTDNADPSTNGGVIADYEYGGMYIGNSADEIILTDETGAIVDEVQYTNSWPFASGVSMEIHDVDANNFLEGNWFEATLAYGDGDYGTPGTNYDGTVNVDDELAIPGHFRLFPPYPNPFNPTTTIRFNISAEAPYIVSIDVFDLTGRLVETLVEGFSESGFHEIKWNAENYTSGVYYFKLDWGSQSQIQKAVLIK